jgi:hypothetical protein
MPIDLDRIQAYADLGTAWHREHSARIQQRHLQFGRHLKIDLDALLARAALSGRGEVPPRRSPEDLMRRATFDAIEHGLRLDALGAHDAA